MSELSTVEEIRAMLHPEPWYKRVRWDRIGVILFIVGMWFFIWHVVVSLLPAS